MLPLTFESERLLARLPVPDDAPLLFAAYTSKPEVSRYMMWRPHQHIDETTKFVAECIAAVESGTRFPYVLFERTAPHQPIGMLEARPLVHKVDLGYVLAPEHWGKGYMPEAVRKLVEHCLEIAAFFRVQAFCDVENVPSQRTLEKAGFLREGRHERFVVHPNLSSEPRTCFMYARCR
jgi:RimJ/RimL family protein N-acetyltransferase